MLDKAEGGGTRGPSNRGGGRLYKVQKGKAGLKSGSSSSSAADGGESGFAHFSHGRSIAHQGMSVAEI